MELRDLENVPNYEASIASLCEQQGNFSLTALNGEFVLPPWIDKSMTFYNADMILYGDWSPVAFPSRADEVTRVHGTDILHFILEEQGELPAPDADTWQGVSVFLLGFAVRLWLTKVEEQLVKLLEQNPG